MRPEAVNLRIDVDSGLWAGALIILSVFRSSFHARADVSTYVMHARARANHACNPAQFDSLQLLIQKVASGLRSRESNYVRFGCGRCPGEAGTTLAPLPRAGGLRAILVSSPARPGRRRPTVHTGSIPDQRRSCDCMRCRHRLPRRTSKETIILPLYETSEKVC